MRRRRTKQILLGLLALLAALAAAAPAGAVDPPYEIHCTIQGTATADVNLIGGGGTYHFTEFTAPCTGHVAHVPFVSTANITSDGDFFNTIC